MAQIWVGTKHPGVRYREHPSRKHGVRFDRYFAIRYQKDGRRQEEGLGWWSEGWTETKAALELEKLKSAAALGESGASLREKRAQARARLQAEQVERERLERERVSFGDFFREAYLPYAMRDGKSPASVTKEESLYRLWIASTLAGVPMVEVSPFHLERIKQAMSAARKSPRTVQYALAVVRQVFNHARRVGIHVGESPTAGVRKPRVDNRRLRFLSREEAERLLAALVARSPETHALSLLSLHCGLRAGELFKLAWSDVDLARGTLTLRDTKSGRCRHAILTTAARSLLGSRSCGLPGDLVFPARGGGRQSQISDTFNRVVAALGLNDGLTDPRQKVVFHTLRHTFASWLVERGVDLYTVKELMGHGQIAMTERYSHLAPDTLRRAVGIFEAGLQERRQNGEASELRAVGELE